MDRRSRSFELDVAAYRLLCDGRPVRLERQPMELLILLGSRPGTLVTREEIAARFWGNGVFVDVEGSINRIVAKLRLALHDDSAKPRFIETVVGKGYRLITSLDPRKPRATMVEDQEVFSRPTAAHNKVARAEFTTPGRGLDVNLPASLRGKRSIAVLPFKLLTQSGDDGFLSVALADAIITHLGASPNLFVRPIGMVQRYAGESADPLTAARELNVQVVVSGTVQRVDTKLRVCLQAVDATNGSVVLSAKHDAEMIELFALQDAIAESLAKGLQFELNDHKESVEHRPDGNRMSYELFLRAADKLSRLNRWDTQAAIDMLGRAVQIDPRFAAAWARLAEAHLLMAFTFGQGARSITAAERAARRALALDPSNSVAQCSHGLVLWSPARGFQNNAALRALSIALKLNPGNLTARLWQCLIFLHVGLFDAAEEGLEIALAVRPDDATTVMFLGQSAMYRHHYDEADGYHARALAMDAAHSWTNVFYPIIPLYRGALADAESKIAVARDLQGDDPWLTSCEALLWAKRGETAKAERLLRTALRGKPLFHTHHMWHTAAATYATLGKHRRALSLLERASAFGLPNFTLFRDDPHFHSLRALRGFQKLLARLQRERRSLAAADVEDAS